MHLRMRSIRNQLLQVEIAFILRALDATDAESPAVLNLLTDCETVDAILDQQSILDAVLNDCATLRLPSRLYFYLITRHSLKSSGLDDPELSDYVSGILDANLHQQTRSKHIFYVVDWLEALQESSPARRYSLYVNAGDTLLYLTGLHRTHLAHRTRRRGAPSIGFYEDVAREAYRSALTHPLGETDDHQSSYQKLADDFSLVRSALNDAVERLMHFD